MASSSRRWRELSPVRRAAVMSVAAVDLGLRTWALVDRRRRPAENVKGPEGCLGRRAGSGQLRGPAAVGLPALRPTTGLAGTADRHRLRLPAVRRKTAKST